jgi:hypothetical protein
MGNIRNAPQGKKTRTRTRTRTRRCLPAGLISTISPLHQTGLHQTTPDTRSSRLPTSITWTTPTDHIRVGTSGCQASSVCSDKRWTACHWLSQILRNTVIQHHHCNHRYAQTTNSRPAHGGQGRYTCRFRHLSRDAASEQTGKPLVIDRRAPFRTRVPRCTPKSIIAVARPRRVELARSRPETLRTSG